MKSNELIRELSLRLNKPQKETRKLLEECTHVIKTELDHDHIVSLPGLGIFRSHMLQKRKSYDPFHKNYILLPEKRTILFQISKTVKSAINPGR